MGGTEEAVSQYKRTSTTNNSSASTGDIRAWSCSLFHQPKFTKVEFPTVQGVGDGCSNRIKKWSRLNYREKRDALNTYKEPHIKVNRTNPTSLANTTRQHHNLSV